MKIFRIRREYAKKGWQHRAAHADVIAESGEAALQAAEEHRVHNWRWIDHWDTSDEDYERYILIGKIWPHEARIPREPDSLEAN